MNEAGWESLLGKIHEGTVVPIIGSRLLVGADGESSLQAKIAERLIRNCGQEIGNVLLPPFRELNEAVSQLRSKFEDEETDLYDRVCKAIHDVTRAEDFSIPAPIRQLAEIADFRLFVTLTPDDLLVQSLRLLHRTANEIVHVPSQKFDHRKDLAGDWDPKNSEANVLYLFGKACLAPKFAIHDEDALEYAHNIIAHPEVMENFRNQLQVGNLLLIGCDVPEWLSRFFLRVANDKRLSESIKRTWVIEPSQLEQNLINFLTNYSRNTTILSATSPTKFVGELNLRWKKEYGAGKKEATHTTDDATSRRKMFFISYSRGTDLPHAEALYQALLKLGVKKTEVWFDNRTLESGQDYQRGILDGIRTCGYFLPLLSHEADRRKEAFVFGEWVEANKRLINMNRKYVVPIVIDPEFSPQSYTAEPAQVWADKPLNFAHAPGGRPDSKFEDELREMVRIARKGGLD